jgi:AcrR family transcriptional regulator
MSLSKKINILKTAEKVFYKNGYHATGVEKLAREANTTKATLYSHFQCKDNLIVETLRDKMENFHRELGEFLKSFLTAKEKILAIFDFLEQSVVKEDFYGCPFINAAAEYSEQDNKIHEICTKHYMLLGKLIESEAEKSGIVKSRKLAEQIIMLIMGAYSGLYIAMKRDAFKNGRSVAKTLLNSSI